MKHLSFFILLSFFLTFTAGSLVAEEKKSIDGAIYVAQSDTSGGIKLSMNTSVLPRVSQLGGESPRIILDFDETVYHTPNKINVVENPLVRSLRFGLHQEPLKTRMVIDLVGSCKIKKPIITEEESGVLILLNCQEDLTENKTNEILRAAEKKKIVNMPSPAQQVGMKGFSVIVENNIEEPLQQGDAAQEETNGTTTKNTEEPAQKDAIITKDEAVDDRPVQDAVSADIDIDEPIDILVLEPKQEALAETEEKLTPEVSEGQEVKNSETNQLDSKKLNKHLQLFEISYNRVEERDEELVLFYLNDFSPPHVSAVEEGKLQVVCDFDQVDLGEHVEKFIKADGKYVISITSFEEVVPQKVRVLIELSIEHDYDLQQIFYKNDNVFSLIITGQAVETP